MSVARDTLQALLRPADIVLDGSRAWDLQVKDERLPARVLAAGTLGFGEAYMDGWWDCEAIDQLCERAVRADLDRKVLTRRRRWTALGLATLFNLQSRRRAPIVGRKHYDLGNDFFAAMLGPTLQYSCAYYSGDDDLDAAQRRKLDLICRKLALRPGLHVLDIGCGWGGLARHIAKHHQCSVVGITISHEQQAAAQQHCAGLPVEIRVQDYRAVPDRFDRVVSVGMMEHVGYKNYRAYLQAAHRALREGGVFLCHTIGGNRSTRHSDPWIHRYIFPNSMLPSPAQVTRAAEGLFVLEDVHNFGVYYDRTLLAWHANFEQAWPRFADRYGERFQRMWRYYLLSCAGTFRARNIQLFQFVFAKGGIPGGFPATR